MLCPRKNFLSVLPLCLVINFMLIFSNNPTLLFSFIDHLKMISTYLLNRIYLLRGFDWFHFWLLVISCEFEIVIVYFSRYKFNPQPPEQIHFNAQVYIQRSETHLQRSETHLQFHGSYPVLMFKESVISLSMF